MNVLTALLQENPLLLSEAAAVANGPDAEWLVDRLAFRDVYAQAVFVPNLESLFRSARLPTYPLDRWEDEQIGLQAFDGLTSWVELIRLPDKNLGVVVPNDAGYDQRISLLASVRNGLVPVWATFTSTGEQRVVTAVGLDQWHCPWKDGGCPPLSSCGGVCQLMSVHGQAPGAKRCLCDLHGA